MGDTGVYFEKPMGLMGGKSEEGCQKVLQDIVSFGLFRIVGRKKNI